MKVSSSWIRTCVDNDARVVTIISAITKCRGSIIPQISDDSIEITDFKLAPLA